MKYIDSKSILINDNIALYNADGSQEEYVPFGDTVRFIHSQKLKHNNKKYELYLAEMPYGDKTIYYKYGVENGYETDRIHNDFQVLIDAEITKLKFDLLFDKAKSLL